MPVLRGPASTGGDELAYAQITGIVTISGTAQATPTDSGLSITFIADGASSYYIEFFAPYFRSLANGLLFVDLWEDGAVKEHLNLIGGGSHADMYYSGAVCKVKVTPSAASHTYKVQAYRSAANGEIGAGTGTGGDYAPAYLRAVAA